jgi:predicted dithiol-disulfide oxidoreductase (DUF899 family)
MPFREKERDGTPTAVRLSELFVRGKDWLVIYSFMFPRDAPTTIVVMSERSLGVIAVSAC